MFISKITKSLNKLTPGMNFSKFAKNVLYRGQNCGYIEHAGKRKYVLTPTLDKLEKKLELNDFKPQEPRFITPNEFDTFKLLLKPIIKNEKGLKKLNLNKNLYYSPSTNSIVIWDKQTLEPVTTIIKQLQSPTKEIFYNRFPFLRKLFRESPHIY